MGGQFCSWVYLSVCANFGSGYTFILPTGMAMLHKNFPGQIRDTLTSLLLLDDRPKLAEILVQRNQDGQGKWEMAAWHGDSSSRTSDRKQ